MAKRLTVLIVEDEFLIALGAAELLKDAGYDTVEASNADDAVAVLESGREIGAVFTDIRHAGFYGRPGFGMVCPRPMAPGQASRHLRPSHDARRRSAGGRSVYSQALQRLGGRIGVERFDRTLGCPVRSTV